MGLGFNWFKSYEIYCDDDWYKTYRLTYNDGDSTSHSHHNVNLVQKLLEKYGGVRIPQVDDYDLDNDYEPDLIEPEAMSEACRKVLETIEVDEVDMRDRIQWFKQLSDEGYYLSYDLE